MADLELTNSRVPGQADHLTRSGITGLRRLALPHCNLGDEDAARLAAWPGLARLRVLDLSGNRIGPKGLLALADSPHAGSLEALMLDSSAARRERAVRARSGLTPPPSRASFRSPDRFPPGRASGCGRRRFSPAARCG
ncbi:MAG: hypothetical protein K2W96_21490 [Gemmataceae bacterium]|nr:hypothetical protein [Gemmataceae bacterium]